MLQRPCGRSSGEVWKSWSCVVCAQVPSAGSCELGCAGGSSGCAQAGCAGQLCHSPDSLPSLKYPIVHENKFP